MQQQIETTLFMLSALRIEAKACCTASVTVESIFCSALEAIFAETNDP
jgi:hypothetical protein